MNDNNELIKTLMCEVPQFDNLTSEELDKLSESIFYHQAPSGTVLCKEGNPGDSLFYIVKGKIEIRKETIDGRQTILARFNKGASVGEMSLIENSPRSATATAIEDSEFLILTSENFERLLETNPQIGIKVLRNIARSLSTRLRYTSGRFADVFK
ncbi:hypothetical protein MNBD_NITROSPINAE02-734 [hydrothermal vent metagenome]|uniref:Cyclic nucleotide-binding domain-containing protein n=1 Tax=hydrothermal vent metagenome TaxID=652676 RepID=A0A3B1C053_9ZZZZ